MKDVVLRSTSGPVARVAEPAQARALPLGTADWYRGGGRVLRRFENGDFWLGWDDSRCLLGYRDDTHVFIGANTRSGKGVSVLIPMLCTFLGSALVIDPKGENAMVTARRRGAGSKYCAGFGQKVYVLDPFGAVQRPDDDFADVRACFNPLASMSADNEESVAIASRIAESFIVAEGTAETFWNDAAKEAIKGIILHVATSPNYLPHERNLVTVRKLIMEGDTRAQHIAALASGGKKAPSAFSVLSQAMRRNPAFGGAVAETGATLAELETSPKTFLGVMQSARTNTDFISDPHMKRCLSASTFSLGELKTDSKGVTVYLSLPQRHMDTHYRWLRMMVTLGVGEMERIRHQPRCGHPVLMVLDEFPALKRMRVIENAAAQIAGNGVKLVFVVQTLAQLKEEYKDNWETLLGNAGIKLFFCNDDQFTRQYVSQLVGDCEVVRSARSSSETHGSSGSTSEFKSSGYSSGMSMGHSSGHSMNSGGGGGENINNNVGWNNGHSTSSGTSTTWSSSSSKTVGFSENVQKRPLITPDEVGRWFGNREVPRMLALVSGYQPIALQRVPYFKLLHLGGFYDPHPDHPLPLLKEAAKSQYRVWLAAEEQRKTDELARIRSAELQERWRLAKEKEDARKEREEAARRSRRENDARLEHRRNERIRFWTLKIPASVSASAAIITMAWWMGWKFLWVVAGFLVLRWIFDWD